MTGTVLNEIEQRERVYGEMRWALAKQLVEPVIAEACNDESALSLLPNHEQLLRSTAKKAAFAKSRKIAQSWGHSLYAFTDSLAQARHTNIIISIDEDEAQEKRNFLEWMWDAQRAEIKAKFKMTGGKEEKSFSNGARIQFPSRKPPTGRGATVHLDEFAVPSRSGYTSEEILIGALGCTTHRGRVLVSSTERDPMTTFHRIITGELNDGGDGDWQLYFFPWWTSPALCVDPEAAMRVATLMPTYERVHRFGNQKLRDQFSNYLKTPGLGLEIFQREFECRVLDERDSYFPLDLIRGCESKDSAYWFDDEDCHGSREVEKAFRCIDRVSVAIRTGLLRGDWAVAMDVGRDADRSELMLGHSLPEDRAHLLLRACITLNQMPFPEQRKVYEYAMKQIRTTRGYVDGTKGSVGRQLSEELHKAFGQRAMPFEFTPSNRSVAITGLRSRMEKNGLTLPDFESLRMQLLSIKKKVTQAGTVIFDAERNKFGHSDKAMTLAMLSDLFDQPGQGSADIVTGTVAPRGYPLVGHSGYSGQRPTHGGSRIIRPDLMRSR